MFFLFKKKTFQVVLLAKLANRQRHLGPYFFFKNDRNTLSI